GCYGKGVEIVTLPSQSRDAWRNAAKENAQPAAAPEPQGARPPGVQQLDDTLQAISALGPVPSAPGAFLPLSDDWRTGGNWIGRYGCYWACLFAMGTTKRQGINWTYRPNDHRIDMRAAVGPGGMWGEGLRFWIYARQSTNRRSLEIPASHLPPSERLDNARLHDHWGRETECDDHGEVYPLSQSGPGIICQLHLPAGVFEIGLYAANFDGHGGANCLRDYVISATCHGQSHSVFPTPKTHRSRVICFFDGVYKRWLVVGPAEIHLKISRNHSFNTIMSGFFVDRVGAGRRATGMAANLLRVWASRDAWQRVTRPHRTAMGAAKSLAVLLPALLTFNTPWYEARSRLGYTELLRWDFKRLDDHHRNKWVARDARMCVRRLNLFYLQQCLHGQMAKRSPTLAHQAIISAPGRAAGVRRLAAANSK
ncbi:MAG: hypothetical protein ACP5O1_11490, partial [Phycisphaerae bacterium]